MELSDLPLATMLCKTFFNCGLGAEDDLVMTVGEADVLIGMVRTLLEQCSEPEFAQQVIEEGGDSGADTLQACLTVARALAEQLDGRLQVAAASSQREQTDHTDLEPLPMPKPDETLACGRDAVGVAVSARQQRLSVLTSADNSG